MNPKYRPFVLGVAFFVVGLLVACSGGGNATPPQETPAPGQPLDEGGVSVTLNSTMLSGHTLEASFTVANRGEGDLTFDPETGFAARGERPLSLDLAACQGRLLKGVVPAGGELTGDLCWKADPTETAPKAATITYGTAASISMWEVEAE